MQKMKFRKKQIVIEAYQTDKEMIIHTLEGDMLASPGDWIITGVNGEQYPCKPDIFEKTYDLAYDISDVRENPYEKIWNDLKKEINVIIYYLKDVDKYRYWPGEDRKRLIYAYENTLKIMSRLEKENRINVDFFVKK